MHVWNIEYVGVTKPAAYLAKCKKMTSNYMNFVSIHNSLYTQCIGALIKNKPFFFLNIC